MAANPDDRRGAVAAADRRRRRRRRRRTAESRRALRGVEGNAAAGDWRDAADRARRQAPAPGRRSRRRRSRLATPISRASSPRSAATCAAPISRPWPRDLRAQIADDLRALAQRARDAANARVVAGDVPRSDLTQSDLALANSENELVGARGEAMRDARRVERACSASRPIRRSTFADPLSTAARSSRRRRRSSWPTQSNVDLQVLDRQIAEQIAKVNLAKALTIPDLAAGGTFTYDAEPEFRFGWRVSGGVTLPDLHQAQGGRGRRGSDARAPEGRSARRSRRGSPAVSRRRWHGRLPPAIRSLATRHRFCRSRSRPNGRRRPPTTAGKSAFPASCRR